MTDLLYAWAAGDTTPGFSRTGSAPYIDASGVVHNAASGVARVSRDPTGEMGLLLEETRAFGWTWPDDLSNAVWAPSFLLTPVTDGTLSPDGVTEAYKLIPNTNIVATHRLTRNFPAATDDTTQTLTVALKAGGYNYAALMVIDRSGAAWTSVVNLADGSIASKAAPHTIDTTALANGWWLVRLTTTSNHGASTLQFRAQVYSDAAGTAFGGDGTSGIYAWRLNVEADKSFATSSPAATSIAPTRNADSWTDAGVITGADVGVSGTRYEHYYDLATRTVVEQVAAITTAADIAYPVNRVWRAVKIARGTYTLAEMQAMSFPVSSAVSSGAPPASSGGSVEPPPEPITFAAEFTHLLDMEFSSGHVYFTTGAQDLMWDGKTWQAVGGLLELGGIEETSDSKGQGIDLKLSGVDQTIIALLLTSRYRGYSVRVYRAYLDADTGLVVGTPITLFAGLQLNPYEIEESRDRDSGTVTISTRVSGYFDVDRVRGIQTNLVSHQHHYPGDTFFQYVASLQNKKIYWGTAEPMTAGRRLGGGSGDTHPHTL